MAELNRVGTLEVEQDLRFQVWQWRAAGIVWALLLAVMVATGLGVFGAGVLSRARAGAEGAPLWVEYDRVARFGASVRFVVHARPQPDGSVRVTIGRPLLEAFRVQHVTPAPASTALVADGVEYRFHAETPDAVPVNFDVQPATRWVVGGWIRSGAAAVQLRQLVLP